MNTPLIPQRFPPGYPADLERWVALVDGRRVFVRPLVEDDADALEDALAQADEQTVYQRFFRAPVRLDAKTLQRLTHLDYERRLALVAISPDGNGVGVARYESVADGDAEIAVVVNPEWRHAGLGYALLEMLEQAATVRGIRRLTALYLPDNLAIARLLERRGFAVGLPDDAVAAAEKLIPAA